MKKYLAIPLLLFSFVTFSQTDDKEMLSLMDSIKAVDPYESLYAEINELYVKEKNHADEIHHFKEQEVELKEFFFRQILYRNVFDQLELGISPDTLELKKYRNVSIYGDAFWIPDDWSLFEFPKPDSKSPIIIFYDPGTNARLNDSQILKGYPFSDFGIAFKNEDPVLKKRYPKVYAMIKNGKLIFSPKSFATPPILAMQALKLEFPSSLFSNRDKSPQSRQILADNLLIWISDVAAPVLSHDYTTENLVSAYLKVEKEKLKKGNVEDKIELRMKFIEYLRKKYNAIWK
jgi:hypothetical protein